MSFDGFDQETSERLLDSVHRWWAAHQDIANRPQISLATWLGLSPTEQNADWQVGIAAVRSIQDLNDVRVPVGILGRRRYEGAVPLFIDMWRRCAVEPIRTPAGDGLFAIGSREARAALRERIDDRDDHQRFLALKTLFTDPGGGWDNAGWLFDDARLETEAGIRVANETLRLLSPTGFSREGPIYALEAARYFIAEVPRWLELCVRLRKHPSLGRAARSALRYAEPATTTTALDRAAADARFATRRSLSRLVAGSLLARYEAGEYKAVWRELGQADPLDKVWRAEAALVAAATMRRVQGNTQRLIDALMERGWPIAHSEALSSPAPDTEERLDELEQLLGVPVPPALGAFWRIVGGINLVPSGQDVPPALPAELIQLDPLQIYGASAVRYALDEWLTVNDGVHREISLPLELPISADNLHKAGISGGGPYSIWLPSTAADPIVRDEPHGLSFTEYLRRAFENRGFLLRHESRVDEQAEAWLAALDVDLEPF